MLIKLLMLKLVLIFMSHPVLKSFCYLGTDGMSAVEAKQRWQHEQELAGLNLENMGRWFIEESFQ